MKIVLASRNKKKIEELRQLLGELLTDVEVLSLDDVGITGDIEEDGTTFEENALIKARVAAGSGYIGVADDSGLAWDWWRSRYGQENRVFLVVTGQVMPCFFMALRMRAAELS